jgi:hypothetical protein
MKTLGNACIILLIHWLQVKTYLEYTFRKALENTSLVIFPSGLKKNKFDNNSFLAIFLLTSVPKILRAFLVICLHPNYRLRVRGRRFVAALALRKKEDNRRSPDRMS